MNQSNENELRIRRSIACRSDEFDEEQEQEQ